MTGKSIALCMIVKDDADVLRRAISSVVHRVDSVTVADTGSADIDSVKGALRSTCPKPPVLLEMPWSDFATNRNEAMDVARTRGDYVLTLDADDWFEFEPGFEWPDLTADAYAITIQDAGTTYSRPMLVRSDARRIRWRGVLHEFLDTQGAEVPLLPGVVLRRGHDGARRRDPGTYARDAETLKAALSRLAPEDEDLRPRYTFYLAQSFRDAGDADMAAIAYQVRAGMGGWDEEVFVSWLNAARLREAASPASAMALYQNAVESNPRRAEAHYGLARLFETKGCYEDGYAWAKDGLAIPKPSEGLFLESWVHDWGLLDQVAVHAHFTGRYAESLRAAVALLASRSLPPGEAARVAANAEYPITALCGTQRKEHAS